MLKNSKVVLFLSPYKVGQAGNFWTLPRMYEHYFDSSYESSHFQSGFLTYILQRAMGTLYVRCDVFL